MNIQEGIRTAQEVIAKLSPLCLKDSTGAPMIRVAGSVRRRKLEMIKDVEICLVPDTRQLFELRKALNTTWGEPVIGAFPSKYVRIRGRYNLDIFIGDVNTWGMLYFIRTGPQAFVTRALSSWKKKTAGGYSKDCLLHLANGKVVPTPDEESVFAALDWQIVKPENRI